MPELKYLRRPSKKIIALDDNGQPVDLVMLEGRRIKWARRKGNTITVMIEGPRKGAQGVLLHFANAADYECSVRRVFKPNEAH